MRRLMVIDEVDPVPDEFLNKVSGMLSCERAGYTYLKGG